jgi:hypothetical protein
MFRRSSTFLLVAMTFAFAFATSARAETLGSSTQPANALPGLCDSNFVYVQETSDPSVPYQVLGDGDRITGWQTDTDLPGTNAGAAVTFLVLRPTGPGSYDLVGHDTETLPDPLPASGVASFDLVNPIVAAGGDKLALYSADHAVCFFGFGATPAGARVSGLTAPATFTSGEPLSQSMGGSPGGLELNLSATVDPAPQDVAVATGAAGVVAGNYAVLPATVTDNGPSSRPVTFTDTVPAGLAVVAAVTSGGPCTTAGLVVSCTVAGLHAGQSAPVSIVVGTSTPGSYTNVATVASSTTDPNTANNTAGAPLVVTAAPTQAPTPAPAPTPKCVVPSLKKVPLSAAKKILKLLGCKVGKTKKAHSSAVAKGLIVKTSPKAGTYAAGRTIALTESSGKAKKKKKK